jgi:L-aspartate oxidase
LVFAERVARDLAATVPLKQLPAVGKWSVPPFDDRGAAQVAADRVREVMWQHAGIARTAKGLRTAFVELSEIEERLPEGATEEMNLVQTARLIVEGALKRKESRGGHYRSDFPRAKRTWQGRHIEL